MVAESGKPTWSFFMYFILFIEHTKAGWNDIFVLIDSKEGIAARKAHLYFKLLDLT